jgi:methionyl-tRNA formyltransferase
MVGLIGVVTAPDRPSGRRAALTPTPVARRAAELGVPILRPDRVRSPKAIAAIAALGPELGVLADYGQIVPRAIIDLPPRGILNVHPSLLPRHRGATPIPATIAEGDPVAGVTIIDMDAGLDTGPIVASDQWPLTGSERAGDLEAEAAARGAALLLRTLEPWLDGAIWPVPQGTDATLTRSPASMAASTRRGARELERQVRANQPWPGAFLETADGRVSVLSASVAPTADGDIAGLVVRHGDRPALVTADGRLILDEVRPAGGRDMTGDAYLRGHPGILGQPVVPVG